MSKNKLYIFVLLACFVGYLYLGYSVFLSAKTNYGVCMIKNITGYPCPSCGTTRAVKLMWEGKPIQSVLMNPFGVFVFLIMTIAPIWILIDVVNKKQSFYNFYNNAEITVRTKWLAIIFVILVVLNWFWNFKKGL